MAKVRKLFSTGFFHIFSSTVINKMVGFFSTMILVRILSKTEYGAYTYALNIFGLVTIVNGMGIDSGVLQLTSEHSGDVAYADRMCNYGTRFGLKFDLLLVATMLGIGLFAPLKIESGRRLICLMCMLPMFQFMANMMSCYLRSQKRNQEMSRLLVFSTLAGATTSLVGALLFREVGMVMGQYVSQSATVAIAVFAYGLHFLKTGRGDIGSDKKVLLKLSFISMLNNGLSQLLLLLDVFVLGLVDPQETILASYKIATTIPTALAFIPSAIVVYIYPLFAEHRLDKEWCLRRYKQLMLALGGFNLVLSGTLFAFAPLVIKLFFGEQYLDAVPVFRILAINYFVGGTFRTIAGNLLASQRKLKFNLYVGILTSCMNIIADYFFIQWWGSVGAAYATLLVVTVSSIISTTYLIIVFKRKRVETL